jgi:P63C domain-containing protein
MSNKSEKILETYHTGNLKIGDVEIECAVLEDGTRVLTQKGFLKAIGRSPKASGASKLASGNLPPFLSVKALEPFISQDLYETTTPVKFRVLKTEAGRGGAAIAHGYKADLLPEVCNVYLAAREAGKLSSRQLHIAKQCEILMRGFSSVGIIALVDEATGYQAVRARDALEKILEKFISKELAKWAKTFPDDFYEHIYRLRGISYSDLTSKRPPYMGKITNDLIYERLAPQVLKELKKKNPADDRGRRKHKYHQWLTSDVGHPKLREHLYAVITLMKASSNWRGFYGMLNRSLPKWGDLPLFDRNGQGEKNAKKH